MTDELPWSPDQPLRKDATDKHIEARRANLWYAAQRGITLHEAAILAARELQAATIKEADAHREQYEAKLREGDALILRQDEKLAKYEAELSSPREDAARWRRAYMIVADATSASSMGPLDLATQIRTLRKANEDAEAELATLREDAARNARIVQLLRNGGYVKPSKINPGYFCAFDVATEFDVCSKDFDAMFTELFDEIDAARSTGTGDKTNG